MIQFLCKTLGFYPKKFKMSLSGQQTKFLINLRQINCNTFYFMVTDLKIKIRFHISSSNKIMLEVFFNIIVFATPIFSKLLLMILSCTVDLKMPRKTRSFSLSIWKIPSSLSRLFSIHPGWSLSEFLSVFPLLIFTIFNATCIL